MNIPHEAKLSLGSAVATHGGNAQSTSIVGGLHLHLNENFLFLCAAMPISLAFCALFYCYKSNDKKSNDRSSVIESPEVADIPTQGKVDISQLPSTTVNGINVPFTGAINNPRIIGVNIEQHKHMPAPPVPFPEQTPPNELEYYVSTSFEVKMRTQLEFQTNEIKKLAVHGITGSGKTVLTKHYYQQCHQKYEIHQVLNAENIEKWGDSLSNFAKRLSPGLEDRLDACQTLVERKKLINITIQAALHKKTWCILVDNWDRAEELNEEENKEVLEWENIDENFEVGSGLLLVTTQHPSPFNEKICALDLSRSSKKESDIRLFVQESCQILDRVLKNLEVDPSLLGTQQERETLAQTLGYLPLALVQAGCYILWENRDRQENGESLFTYQNYESLLNQETSELVKKHKKLFKGKANAPAITQQAAIKLCLEKAIQIKSKNPKWDLWYFLCFGGSLASNHIPKQLLKDYLEQFQSDSSNYDIDEHFTDIRRAAQNYSLLYFEPSNEPSKEPYFYFHRIVQKVIRDYCLPELLSEKGKPSEIVMLSHIEGTSFTEKIYFCMMNALLEKFIPKEDNNTNFTVLKDYIPHITTWLEYNQNKLTGEKILKTKLKLQNNLALAYRLLGDYLLAEKWFNKILPEEVSFYGEDSLEVAKTRGDLGLTLRNLTRYRDSRRFYKKALKARIDKLGEDSEEVAEIRCNLGTVLEKLGKFDYAEKELKKGIRIYKRNRNQRKKALSQSILALTLCVRHEYGGSLRLHKKSLLIMEKHYGDEVVEIAKIKNNMVLVLQNGNPKQLKQAFQLISEVLKAVEDFCKEKGKKMDGDILRIERNKASIMSRRGEHRDAILACKDILRRQQEIMKYGEDHIEVAIMNTIYGEVLERSGDIANAVKCYIKSWNIKIKYYNYSTEEHSEVKKIRQRLSDFSVRHEQAIEQGALDSVDRASLEKIINPEVVLTLTPDTNIVKNSAAELSRFGIVAATQNTVRQNRGMSENDNQKSCYDLS